jgi:hypothetical protein
MNHSLEAYSCAAISPQVCCDAINRGATSLGGCALRAESLMQQGSQRFTFGQVKLRLHGFWPGRLLFETSQALLRVSMDRIEHCLGRTAQVAGDYCRTLPSAGRKQNLASAQGKGI